MASQGPQPNTEVPQVPISRECSGQLRCKDPRRGSGLGKTPAGAEGPGSCLPRNVRNERERRKRISTSCERLRALLPQFEGRREDMASVLEMSVQFLRLASTLVPSWEQGTALAPSEEMWHKWQEDILHLALASQALADAPDVGMGASCVTMQQASPSCAAMGVDEGEAPMGVAEVLDRPVALPAFKLLPVRCVLSSFSPTGGEAGPSHSPAASTEEWTRLAVDRVPHSMGTTRGLQVLQERHEGAEVTQQGDGLRGSPRPRVVGQIEGEASGGPPGLSPTWLIGGPLPPGSPSLVPRTFGLSASKDLRPPTPWHLHSQPPTSTLASEEAPSCLGQAGPLTQGTDRAVTPEPRSVSGCNVEDGASFWLTASPDWWQGEWARSAGPPSPLIRDRLWGVIHPDAGLGLCDVTKPSLLCDTKVPVSAAKLQFSPVLELPLERGMKGSVEGSGGGARSQAPARSSPLDRAEPGFLTDPELISQELADGSLEAWGSDVGCPSLALRDEVDSIFPDFFTY